MPFFATAHHTLHYVTEGNVNNPPLLLLHGFLGSHQDFVPLLLTLSHHFYCIVPDLPGHGQTKTEPGGYTFPRTADALLALLRHLNIRETHLLGYSMGGRLALYLVCEFPDCFRRVVLESASPGLKTVVERERRKESDSAIAQRLTTQPLSAFLTRWYQNPLFSSLHKHPQAYAQMFQRRQQNCRSRLAQALCGFSTGRQPSLWPVLADLETPCLLLVGTLDSKFVRINHEMAAQPPVLPFLTVKLIENCGHNVHLEAPEVFSEAVIEFLI